MEKNGPFCLVYCLPQLILHFRNSLEDPELQFIQKAIHNCLSMQKMRDWTVFPEDRNGLFFLSVSVKQPPLSPKIVLPLRPAGRGFFWIIINHRRMHSHLSKHEKP